MKLQKFALLAALTVLPLSAIAQTTYGERHDINGRKENQQDRIAQGDRSGQLTPRETAHLERQEGRINHEEHAMRRADGGHLTAADRHTLARQQNRESARIYRDKHNVRRDPGAPLR